MATAATQEIPVGTKPTTPARDEHKTPSTAERTSTPAKKDSTAPNTPKGTTRATGKEDEDVNDKGGRYGPWNTGLQTEPEFAELVETIITSRGDDPKHPDYPWGEIRNGGARTIYLDYVWDRNKSHSDTEFALIEAGKRWWNERPPKQKTFMEKCIQKVREKMSARDKRISELIILLNEVGGLKQTEHMDGGFEPNDFCEDDMIGPNANGGVQDPLYGNGTQHADKQRYGHPHKVDHR